MLHKRGAGQRWVTDEGSTGHSSGQCIEKKPTHWLMWVSCYISWVGWDCELSLVELTWCKSTKQETVLTPMMEAKQSNSMKAQSTVKFSVNTPLISEPTPESGLLCINSCIMQLEREKRDEWWYWTKGLQLHFHCAPWNQNNEPLHKNCWSGWFCEGLSVWAALFSLPIIISSNSNKSMP